MEGLIPYVYKAIVQYRNGTGGPPTSGSWYNESPSASYIRLPGDSGRFRSSEIQLLHADNVFSTSNTTSSSMATSVSVSQSPHRRSASRRLA
ncbi:hypothetical protein QJS10_CPB14g01644 [Acorus calamus]|uniref:Legume-specific protein n=1 Tax=Acorus calamus TaxID=4465 RepID=A0AAV9DCN0_ACOCL|nr:hypothetical protein QJS10_CPB14g01644 [Acorus calamus]